jgi:hypothetical protein
VEINGTQGGSPPSGSETNLSLTGSSKINFGNADVPNLTTTTYPIAAGSDSYRKYIIGYWTGDFTQITNVKFWCTSSSADSSWGVYEFIKMTGSASYATPITSSAGDPDIPTSQPASANVYIPWFKYPGSNNSTSGSINGIISGNGVASTGSTLPIRLQLRTSASIPAGPVITKTFSLSYDLQ